MYVWVGQTHDRLDDEAFYEIAFSRCSFMKPLRDPDGNEWNDTSTWWKSLGYFLPRHIGQWEYDQWWVPYANSISKNPDDIFVHRLSDGAPLPNGEGNGWVRNLDDDVVRAYTVDMMVLDAKGQFWRLNPPFDTYVPRPLYMHDLTIWYPQWDWYGIDQTVEFVGIPMDEDHPFMVATAQSYEDLIAALDSEYGVGECKPIVNFGSSNAIELTDKNTLHILDIMSGGMSEAVFWWEGQGAGLGPAYSTCETYLERMISLAASGKTMFAGIGDKSAGIITPTDEGKKAIAPLLRFLDHPNQLGAYKLWAPNFEQHLASDTFIGSVGGGYLGDPTGAVQKDGRLWWRDFEFGRAIFYFKNQKADPPEYTNISVPAGSKEYTIYGTLESFQSTDIQLYTNDGLIYVLDRHDSGYISLPEDTVSAEFSVTPFGTTQHDAVNEEIDTPDDADYVEATGKDKINKYAISFPSDLKRLCEYTFAFRYKNETYTFQPVLEYRLYVNGSLRAIGWVNIPDKASFTNTYYTISGLDILREDLVEGGELWVKTRDGNEVTEDVNKPDES